MSRWKNLRGLAFVIAAMVLIFALLPIGTAFELGNDEGYLLINPDFALGTGISKLIWGLDGFE